MQLVVLSYPKHYHITQLCVKHALKYIPNIKKIWVVWDDTHGIEPEIPLRSLIRNKFNLGECPGINWSHLIPHIKCDNNIKDNVGQQIIKLHLDLVINDDFIILDGDTIINQPIDPVNIFYSNRMHILHSRYNHVNHVLGIPNYEYWTNTFMYVKSAWLKGLRDHVHMVTGKSVADLLEYGGFGNFPVYEWELIAKYVLDILKVPRKIEYFDKAFVKTYLFEKHFNYDSNFALNGPDDLSQTFMENLGITVDKKLMMQLNYENA